MLEEPESDLSDEVDEETVPVIADLSSEIRGNLKNHVQNLEPDPEPTDYTSLRNSLCAEAREWRVFSRQADALLCASNLSHLGVMTFTYHHCNTSKRFFIATHPLELWYRNKDRPQSYNYEIIAEGKPSKLYLDLEFDPSCNPNHNGAKMTDTFNKIILHILATDFHLSLNRTHILNLDSSTSKKFSRHIIYQLPFPLAFKTNIEAGSTVIKACNLIREELSHDSTTNFLCKTLKIHRSDLEMLEVKDKKGRITLFVDEGVYTKNRHFRLYGSSKFGREAPLVLSPENQFTIPVAIESLRHEYIFLASLITYSTMIGTIIPVTEIREKTVRIPKPIPALTSKKDKSTYSELNGFILRIISPCTIDLVLHYEGDTILVFVTKEAGYCSNIGRQHKKNRVMYVVHIKRGTYFQKCHDPDCQGYKSKDAMLPKYVLDAVGFKKEEWDDEIRTAYESSLVLHRPLKRIKSESDMDFS